MNSISTSQPTTQAYYEILQQICKPLSSLGVKFFGYTAQDDDNRAYCLGSNPVYARQYIQNKQVVNDIQYRSNTRLTNLHYDFWDFKPLKVGARQLYEMAAEFDHSHTLTITRHDLSLSHCYHFSGTVADEAINQRYLDKMDLLHAFIDYFDAVMNNNPVLRTVYDTPFKIHHQPKHTELVTVKGNPRKMSLQEHAKWSLHFKQFNQYYLTKKERQCLYWIRQGKPVAMIAEIHEVSSKTMERHLSSIKQKFACYTLYQLGEKIMDYGYPPFLITDMS